MFSLFKRKKQATIPINLLKTDLHAHLIPGIDDGPKTMEESVALVRKFSALGFEEITATPHIFFDYYPNTKQAILEKFAVLKQTIQDAAIPIQLRCAAEYYLDDHFDNLLEKDELLPLNNQYILVETSTMESENKLYDHLFNLQTKGFKPILAHPERYKYMKENDFDKLKKRGCLFQINFLSLTGYYGKKVFKTAKLLKQKKYIDFVATDAHHLTHLDLIETGLQSKQVKQFLEGMVLKNNQLFV